MRPRRLRGVNVYEEGSMRFVARIAGAAMLIGLSAPSAQAGYIVTLAESGGDLVAKGSGAIDLTGLTFGGSGDFATTLSAAGAYIFTGPTGNSAADVYTDVSGPTNLGPGLGGPIEPSSGSGDIVGIVGADRALLVPKGYVSGDPLSDTSTYLDQTFARQGLTPGRYVWTWGDGADQNFTLVIGLGVGSGPTPIPEPSTVALLGIGLAGLLLVGARRHAFEFANHRRMTRWA
jgi:hypothetical protein